jgi:hypothetical protein
MLEKTNKLINLHDETLKELSIEWKKTKDPKQKKLVMNRIDRALDYRLTLMADRDRIKKEIKNEDK